MLRVYKSTYENEAFRSSYFSEKGEAKDSPEFAVVLGYPDNDEGIDFQKIHIKFPYTKEFKKYAYESMCSQSSNGSSCSHLVSKCVVLEEGTLDHVYMDYDDEMMLLRLNYETSTNFFFLKRTADVYTKNDAYTFAEFPTDIFVMRHLLSPRKDLYYFTYDLKYSNTYDKPVLKSVDFSGEFPVIETYEVVSHNVYRDGGTTDINFKTSDGTEHNIHIPTPLMGKNRVVTLDGTTMCRIIERNNDDDEYDTVVEKISGVCGLKFFKYLKKTSRRYYDD